MKLPIVRLPPFSCYFIPLWFNIPIGNKYLNKIETAEVEQTPLFREEHKIRTHIMEN
jgi:hypothetical protein